MKVVLEDAKNVKNNLEFCPTQVFDSDRLAKDYVALLALWHFQKTLPLERYWYLSFRVFNNTIILARFMYNYFALSVSIFFVHFRSVFICALHAYDFHRLTLQFSSFLKFETELLTVLFYKQKFCAALSWILCIFEQKTSRAFRSYMDSNDKRRKRKKRLSFNFNIF